LVKRVKKDEGVQGNVRGGPCVLKSDPYFRLLMGGFIRGFKGKKKRKIPDLCPGSEAFQRHEEQGEGPRE